MRLLLVLAAIAPMYAQSVAAYRVDYTIRDAADGAKSPRHYVVLVEGANGRGNFRIGQKVPYATTAGSGNTQWNYADIGIYIQCGTREIGDRVALHTDIEISSVLPPDRAATPVPPNPTIGSSRIESNALVTPGKPVIIASIDDPATTRKLNIEAQLTKE